MADCGNLRPLFPAHVDGECSAEEGNRIEAHLHTCRECRETIARASWEVGLFLLHSPSAPGAGFVGPSAGFAARVMTSIRTEPRVTEPRELPPSETASPPVRLPPPVLAPRATSWGAWAGAAAAAVLAAAAGLLLLDREEPTSAPVEAIPTKGRGSVVALGGGILRWTDRFDRGLSGSVWTGLDDAAPTLPGEALHSPAPSSLQMRLPEGGRLEAGPLSWLAVGKGDEVALLEGAVTAEASSRPLEIEIPGARVTAPGEVEVSVRTAAGAGDAGASAWLGAWAASRKEGAASGGSATGTGASGATPPGIVAMIYARKGVVEVANSSGPVRNSLEKGPVRNSLEKVKLDQGQALILIEGKPYILRRVEDGAPSDKGGWLEGLPQPPRSFFFRGRRGVKAPGAPPLPPGNSSGPVRNSLERTLGNANADARAKAHALSIYESTGGPEAVAAAAGAAGDPSVIVRSTAVRVLALTAKFDRPAALAALRGLARDRDEGVARFSILALKTLKDADALPVFRAVVADAEAPLPGRVYAFDALVAAGDASLVVEASDLAPRVESDPNLSMALEFALSRAYQRAGKERARASLADPRPAVRAAAVRALGEAEAAKAALTDASVLVQAAAAQILLRRPGALDFELLRPLFDSGREARARMWNHFVLYLNMNPTTTLPEWLLNLARQDLSGREASRALCESLVPLLARGGMREFLSGLFDSGTSLHKEALLRHGGTTPLQVLAALDSTEGALRSAAATRLPAVAALPSDQAPTALLLDALRRFGPTSIPEARYRAAALATLVREGRGVAEALPLLLAISESARAMDRLGLTVALASVGHIPEVAKALEDLLADSDREVAELAMEAVSTAIRRNSWSGREPAALFPSASPHPVVRARVAMEAGIAGNLTATRAFQDGMTAAASSERRRVLEALAEEWTLPPTIAPAFFEDPSPTVRLLGLLLNKGEPGLEAARRLSDDPSLWVRAASHATLALSGDAGAAEALRRLVRDQRERPEDSSRLAGSLDPDSSDLPNRVLSVARVVAQAGFVGDSELADDAAIPFLLHVLEDAGQARRLAEKIHDLRNSVAELELIRSLGGCHVRESYDTLLELAEPSGTVYARLNEAVVEALGRLLGFRPLAGPAAYGSAHPLGFVSSKEILARGGP